MWGWSLVFDGALKFRIGGVLWGVRLRSALRIQSGQSVRMLALFDLNATCVFEMLWLRLRMCELESATGYS